MKKISQILFIVICIIALVEQFSMMAGVSGSPTPGIGDAVVVLMGGATVFFLPLSILFWFLGIRGKRFGKIILGIAIVLTGWPLPFACLEIMQLASFEHQQAKEEETRIAEGKKTISLLDQSVLQAATEQNIFIGNAPIGLHLDLNISVPNDWIKLHGAIGSIPFETGFGPEGQHIDLNFFNVSNVALPEQNAMTDIHYTADYYPPAVACSGDYYPCPAAQTYSGDKICIQPGELPRPELANKEFNFSSAEYGIQILYPEDPIPSKFKTQILQKMAQFRNHAFWQQAEKNLNDDKIRASGFKECSSDSSNSIKIKGLTDSKHCYCRIK